MLRRLHKHSHDCCTEISRASGDEADADESNEQAYAELVEFIRVAAQVVFEELLPLRQQVYPAPPPTAACTEE